MNILVEHRSVRTTGEYLKTNMSEPIPLRATLRVQLVPVIVADTGSQSLDLVLEAFPVESWDFGMVQR